MYPAHALSQKNLDPQTLEELKDQQGKIANIQNSLQNGDVKSGYVYDMIAKEYAHIELGCRPYWLPKRSPKHPWRAEGLRGMGQRYSNEKLEEAVDGDEVE